MVLVHGSWTDHSDWNPVVKGLSQSFRVITYDRRGHSGSQRVSTQGSFEEDAKDIADLISRLGLAPAHFVGSSAGSTVALKLAANQPTSVRSLIVHEPPLWGLLKDDPSQVPLMRRADIVGEVAKVLEGGDMQGGARLFAEFVAGPGAWDRFPPHVRDTLTTNAATFLDESKDPLAFTVDLAKLSGFKKPTLLTYGGKSPATFKPVIEKLANTIPGSKIFVFDEAGHMPHISHPDKFVATVTAFAKPTPAQKA